MQSQIFTSTARARLRSMKRLAASYAGAMGAQRSLPPGKFVNLHAQEINNQRYLLDCNTRYGPIFKAWQDQSIVICVSGLDRIRRLMSAKEEVLRPVSVPTAAPFPKGLMRVMEGADHTRYRSQLNTALQADNNTLNADSIDATVSAEVERLLNAYQGQRHTHTQLNDVLTRISTGILLQLLYGLEAGSKPYEDLMHMYRALGPQGYVMQIGPAQEHAFERIRYFLSAELERPLAERVIGADSVLGRMINAADFDDVSLGNLIYMAEIGRYDLMGLFRWMLNYAAQHPEIQERLSVAQATEKQKLGLAYVNETLRLNQIERLLRSVREPFVFDDYYFPRHALVRLCLWESHKAPDLFDDPFSFNLDRFMSANARADTLPFGVGKHRCPMASYNLQIGARFICALTTNYRVSQATAEIPFRSRYHWEPARHFTVSFSKRSR